MKHFTKMVCVGLFFSILLGESGPAWGEDWATSVAGGASGVPAAEQVEAAWKELETFQKDMDSAPLLVLEWVVIDAMKDPAQKKALAARLAGLLTKEGISREAQCFLCSMLYRIGSAAEVPAVVPLLEQTETADMARLFLERVEGNEATVALRQAMRQLAGKREAIGMMNSLSLRDDSAAVGDVIEMTASTDPEFSRAAWRALGNFKGRQSRPRAVLFVLRQLQTCKEANPPLEATAIRLAITEKEIPSEASQRNVQLLFTLLSEPYRSQGTRQAAARYRFQMADEAEQNRLLSDWSSSSDPALLKMATEQMTQFDDESLKKLAALEDLAPRLRTALMEELESRLAIKSVPIAALVTALGGEDADAKLATKAIGKRPKEEAGPALAAALDDPKLRSRVIPLLASIKYYEAIDKLLAMARSAEDETFSVGLEGLRQICDPDEPDLKRLLALYQETTDAARRDRVARTIAAVTEKLPQEEARATILLTLVDARENSDVAYQVEMLPLLGRVGSEAVYARITTARASGNKELQNAAATALCHWPNAEHAEELWAMLVSTDDTLSAEMRRQALRAYIRVVSQPSDRPELETLAMLQKAFARAENIADKQLVLTRATTVRIMETVDWAATFLEDKDLSEAACQLIVNLAHHRFLRQPNKERFEPILRKVEATAQEETLIQRAAKARMGM